MLSTLSELIAEAETRSIALSQVYIEIEREQSDLEAPEIRAKMRRRLEVMRKSCEMGLSSPARSLSGISGGDANRFWGWTGEHEPLTGTILSRAVARAIAVTELNASMGCIVATPTAGSAGVLPATLLTIQEARGFSDEQVIDALFTAGGIGTVIARKMDVSGAAGGCQAEVGSATAMAAGAAVELLGGTPRQSGNAVAFALKNMLGLACDPVAGLVEVPCILRNGAGAAQAFVAIDLAMAGVQSLIPPDEVIDAMAQIGRHMDERIKETAQGGLATSPTGKRIAQAIWGQGKTPVRDFGDRKVD